MAEFRSIKELVIETCISEGKFPSYEKLTGLVLQNFPNSKWQRTHYTWYKSKINTGNIVIPGFNTNSVNQNESDDLESEVIDTIEASLSLERDLHQYLAQSVSEIESGLKLVEDGVEYTIDAGRIDLLARDNSGKLVVIELKAGKAKDSAIGQLLGYIGCLNLEKKIDGTRGILVASDFDQRVVFAAKELPHIKLVKYQVTFELQEIT
jgi:endonuclease